MLLIFGVAAAAALAVAAYTRLAERDPAGAARTARAVRQLVAVVAVLARAVDGVLDALQPTPSQPLRPRSVPLRWDHFDDEPEEIDPDDLDEP